MELTKIGQAIKQHRKNAGITQQELAKIIQRTESSIRKYEKGLVNIPIDVVEQIATVFNLTPFDLMGWEYFDVKDPRRLERMKQEGIFDDYLKSLGFAIDHEVTKWHWEEQVDDSGNVVGRAQVDDEWEYILIKDGKAVTFSADEFEELRNGAKDVIETKFYRKVMDKNKKPPT